MILAQKYATYRLFNYVSEGKAADPVRALGEGNLKIFCTYHIGHPSQCICNFPLPGSSGETLICYNGFNLV